jgi:hypothetical protein
MLPQLLNAGLFSFVGEAHFTACAPETIMLPGVVAHLRRAEAEAMEFCGATRVAREPTAATAKKLAD